MQVLALRIYSLTKVSTGRKKICRSLHYHYHSRKVGVQGAPFELGQRKVGVSKGPKVLRETEFVEVLQNIAGLDIKDYGDVTLNFDNNNETANKNEAVGDTLPDFNTHKFKKLAVPRNEAEVGLANQKIADSTEQIVKDGRVCLTLGGDHSIALGTITGVSRIYKNLGVIWVDAHSDINTILTSLSGNLHGMPVSFLLKELEGHFIKPQAFQWVKPSICARNLVYIGLRDVEPFERSIINKLGIKAYSMAEVDKYGINFITEMALDYLASSEGGRPNAGRPIHVSFDVDGLDDLEIPSTGTPVPGGLSLREGMRLMEIIHNTTNVCSMDVVEFNPLLGNAYQTCRSAKAIKELIFSSFGYYRGGVPAIE